MLLEHEEDYTVVDSSQQGLMQHDGFSWEVLGNHFVRLHSVTRQAQLTDQELRGWVQGLTVEPVSYTHLDVYKRQARRRSASPYVLVKDWK